MTNELYCIDFAEWLDIEHEEKFAMLFADPPDSLGLKYKGFKDKLSILDYEIMLTSILEKGSKIADCIWISLNTKYTPLIGHITHRFLNHYEDWEFKPCVQTFTFYQHNHNDLGNGHRLLYRYMRKGSAVCPDTIRVPSWRQLNGDKRADPRGKVPSDVFDFPRVTGNSKQRRTFSPTQLNEGIYERCINLCCPPGSTVVDLFAGSGTLGRVASRCEVNAVMLEVSREICDNILKDQPDTEEVEVWRWKP
jgi:DNA modification methylase